MLSEHNPPTVLPIMKFNSIMHLFKNYTKSTRIAFLNDVVPSISETYNFEVFIIDTLQNIKNNVHPPEL